MKRAVTSSGRLLVISFRLALLMPLKPSHNLLVRGSNPCGGTKDEDSNITTQYFGGHRPMKKYSILLSALFLLLASTAAHAQYTGAWSTTWNNPFSASASVMI